MPALDGWDLPRYRTLLRQRAAALTIDRRIQVRFDESDLVQETLLRAADPNRAPCLGTSDRERLEWLFAIQSNVLLDKYDEHFAQKRDAKREAEIEPVRQALVDSTLDFFAALEGDGPHPPDEASKREEAEILEELLAKLPQQCAEVLRLRKCGYTMAEIAEKLGVTNGVVAGRITQGTQLLLKLSRSYRQKGDHDS